MNRPASPVDRLIGTAIGGLRDGAAGAIYGTILVTAVVVALSEDRAASAAELIEAVATTSVVFWLAHAYSDLVGERAGRVDPRRWHSVRATLAHEWPMLGAAVPPLAALALGAVDVLGRNHAVTTALVLALLQLLTWGFVAGRRIGARLVGALSIGLVTCLLGAAVVLLKALIH